MTTGHYDVLIPKAVPPEQPALLKSRLQEETVLLTAKDAPTVKLGDAEYRLDP